MRVRLRSDLARANARLCSLLLPPTSTLPLPPHSSPAIILGVGGDNVWSRRRRAAALPPTIPGTSIGTFYEGVLTDGYTSDAADDAVQADILSAGYGASTQVN